MLSFSKRAGFLSTDAAIFFEQALTDLQDRNSRTIWKEVRHRLERACVPSLECCASLLTHAMMHQRVEVAVQLLRVFYRASDHLLRGFFMTATATIVRERMPQLFVLKLMGSLTQSPPLRYWAALQDFLEIMANAHSEHLPLDKTAINALLLLAAQAGHLSILKQLIALGADPETRNLQGQTVVQVAFVHDHYDMVCCLLSDYTVNVNAQDLDGYTLLHMAVEAGDTPKMREMIEYFVCGGLDVTLKDVKGKTAEMLGEESGWEPTVLGELCASVSRGTKRKVT